MNEEKKELAKVEPRREVMVVHDDGMFANLLDTARFEHLWRLARTFADSTLVPEHYRKQPANVFIGLQMALRLNIDPFQMLQKLYVVHGKPGIEAQMVIGLVNSRGPFTGPIQWKMKGEGDNKECTAYATHKQTGEVCEVTVTMKMVKAEGWYGKAGSKWQSMPDMMFRYRSATFLARLYCPEVIMGMATAEELADTAIQGEYEVIKDEPKQSPELVAAEACAADPELKELAKSLNMGLTELGQLLINEGAESAKQTMIDTAPPAPKPRAHRRTKPIEAPKPEASEERTPFDEVPFTSNGEGKQPPEEPASVTAASLIDDARSYIGGDLKGFIAWQNLVKADVDALPNELRAKVRNQIQDIETQLREA